MDPEMEVTSAAEGVPEIEVTSAAEGIPEIDFSLPMAEVTIDITCTSVKLIYEEIELPENEVVLDLEPNPKSSGCIFRAPAHIRYGRESDFEPKLVSIGPYYHGRENLKRVEDLKVRCMSDLLKLRPVGGRNIDRVPLDPFMRFERHARCYYKEKFDYSDVDFVLMLVLDSCFIIQIMLSLLGVESMGFLDVNIKEVRSDLLLLENQIPLFFIDEVYEWLFLIENQHKIFPKYGIVLKWFIRLDFPWSLDTRDCGAASTSCHLLELYWKTSAPNEVLRQIIEMEDGQGIMKLHSSWEPTHKISVPKLIENATALRDQIAIAIEHHHQMSVPKLIENATELHQMAGLKFENNYYEGHHGLHVVFSKGVMYMPCLKIDLSQTILLVNLIVYEKSIKPSIRFISSYIKIMDDLIDSEKDVELLQKSGVIYNTLSSHTKAATFFNDIGNFCSIRRNTNPFSDLFENVRKYYSSSWNRRWANLQNNYFNSPWAGISVFAGVILLILTVLQTFYTIYPYYNPRN